MPELEHELGVPGGAPAPSRLTCGCAMSPARFAVIRERIGTLVNLGTPIPDVRAFAHEHRLTSGEVLDYIGHMGDGHADPAS